MDRTFNSSSDDENPFHDPSIVAANIQHKTAKETSQINIDIPRDEKDTGNTFVLPSFDSIQTPTKSGVPIPASSPSFTEKHYSTEQEQLDKRARELDEKERRLAEREREQNEAMLNHPIPNFPPFPKWFPLKPCFYIDINREIPEQRRALCKKAFYNWIAYCCVVLFNFFCAIVVVATVKNKGVLTLILSIFWSLLFLPFSFVFCFRTLYIAFKTNSSFNYILFFASMGIHVGLNILQCLGFQGSGWTGLVAGGTLLEKDHIFPGWICILCGIFYLGLAIFGAYIIRSSHQVYKGSGASVQQAQSEFTTGAWNLGTRGF